jgi:hypothetical protein
MRARRKTNSSGDDEESYESFTDFVLSKIIPRTSKLSGARGPDGKRTILALRGYLEDPSI